MAQGLENMGMKRLLMLETLSESTSTTDVVDVGMVEMTSSVSISPPFTE